MALLPIDQLYSGMVLKSNVCDRTGRILLGQGSVLNERHLRIFKTWGVTDVDIQAPESSVAHQEATPVPALPKSMDAAKKRAEWYFKHTDLSHPAMQQLFVLSVHRIAQDRQEMADHGASQ